MTLQKQHDFREYLNNELTTRAKKNPQYSLRMFSKLLSIESSHLSKLLKGQRPIKAEMVENFGIKLGLTKKDIEKFKKYAPKPYASKKDNTAEDVLDDCYQLRIDQLALISEWQHYAILEVMKHPQFEASAKWISGHLHQPEEIISMAIERLKRVGLLKIEANGQWVDSSEGFSTHVLGENLTSRAHRNYQAQVLDLSKEALYQIPIEKRDHSTICVASSPEKIQQAKLKIKKFRRELAEFLEDTKEKTEIFHLNIGLFPTPNGKDLL